MILPDVSREPLDDASCLERLGSARNDLLRSVVGERSVLCIRKTGTTVDVGHWRGKGIVWIAILENELVLFANGRRPFVEQIALLDTVASQYNHVTGEIVLTPAESATMNTLKLPPLTAVEVLAYLFQGEH